MLDTQAWLRSGAGRPWVVAHRGDSAFAPENTLEAARRAWAAGADAWELDVHRTRDGVPVVLHDESLARTTDAAERFAGDPRAGAGLLVADFDLDEVRRLDAGGWFVRMGGGPRSAAAFGTLDRLDPEDRRAFASGAVRVPTLDEALRLTVRLGWRVNVELKSVPSADPGLADAVLAAVDAAGAAAHVWISSFDHAEVARVARLRPEVATAALVATPLHRPAHYVRHVVGADAYHASAAAAGAGSLAYRARPSPHSLRVDDLRELGREGVPALVYTVNDAERPGLADDLVAAGAAGVFTDDPAARLRGLGRAARG